MADERGRRAWRFAMANYATVQANMIVWTNAHAERRYLAVDSQTCSADPVFNLAT